jgi:hypothetical protein
MNCKLCGKWDHGLRTEENHKKKTVRMLDVFLKTHTGNPLVYRLKMPPLESTWMLVHFIKKITDVSNGTISGKGTSCVIN